MRKKHQSKFFAIFALACCWLIIIFICLNQISIKDEDLLSSADNLRKQESQPGNKFEPPRALEYMKFFLFDPANYTESDILHHAFDPSDFDDLPEEPTNIPKDEHDKLTKSLASRSGLLDKYVRSEGDRLFAFNLLISNKLGSFRPIPDTRNSKCLPKSSRYSPTTSSSSGNHGHESENHTKIHLKLKASVIICYYNEAPSALLRTIKSIIVRSPNQLIEEILVVDDYSRDGYKADDLRPLIGSGLVKMVRTAKREGLIRARLFGAGMARGDVLIFLDSHVEANIGWLEPLIEVVQENKTDIACPMIDLINADTMIYSASPMVQGGLNWALNFKWDSVPSDKLKTYDDFIRPIESPTMAGGLFAIHRDYFYHLGSYDSEMELWGGENIELSLRTWMCGGRILILPCSRLGHIFRKTRPYGPAPGQPDSLLVNSNRAAHVWLDEYLEKFYEANPNARSLGEINVTQRLELKLRLKCKNFTWFMDNVYPKLKEDSNIHSDGGSVDKPKLFNFSGSRRDNQGLGI